MGRSPWTDDVRALLPGAAILLLIGLWIGAEGGFAKTAWLPGALFFIGLLAAIAIAERDSWRGPTRLQLVAAGSLTVFAAWSFASITWAEVRGDAWEGANRTLAYLVIFVLFTTRPWRTVTAALLVGGYVAVTVVVSALEFSAIVADGDPADFIAGRLAAPTGYQNASAALYLMAFWPAVIFASRRTIHPLLRAGFFTMAAGLAQVAAISQSRASLFSFPIVAAAALILVPGRLRLVFATILPLGAVVVSRATLLEPYSAGEDPTLLREALAPIPGAVTWTSLAVGAVGLVWALLDRRVAWAHRTEQNARRLSVAAVLVSVVCLAIYSVVMLKPLQQLDRGWQQFTNNEVPGKGKGHLTAGLGSNRYDFWRVGLDQARSSPFLGVGEQNFAVDYLRERTSVEEPAFPHSLQIKIIGQLGVVGALAFAVFVGAALIGSIPRPSWERRRRVVAAATLMPFFWWFAHGSVDWLWEFPVLSAVAFAFLGVCMSLGRPSQEAGQSIAHSDRGSGARSFRPFFAGGAVIVALAAVCSVSLQWVAARHVAIAQTAWRENPARAFALLERARALDPLSDEPDVLVGVIAVRLRDDARAKRAFERAADRNPVNWYTHLELALLSSFAGREVAALQYLGRARALNPREPLLPELARRIRGGERIHPSSLDSLFVDRTEGLVTSR